MVVKVRLTFDARATRRPRVFTVAANLHRHAIDDLRADATSVIAVLRANAMNDLALLGFPVIQVSGGGSLSLFRVGGFLLFLGCAPGQTGSGECANCQPLQEVAARQSPSDMLQFIVRHVNPPPFTSLSKPVETPFTSNSHYTNCLPELHPAKQRICFAECQKEPARASRKARYSLVTPCLNWSVLRIGLEIPSCEVPICPHVVARPEQRSTFI